MRQYCMGRRMRIGTLGDVMNLIERFKTEHRDCDATLRDSDSFYAILDYIEELEAENERLRYETILYGPEEDDE